jgi:hypothetical protein
VDVKIALTSLDDESLQSRVIALLRFPLMVGIVFIHSSFIPQFDSGLFYVVYTVFSQIISRVSAPFFFFISGYLFFYKRRVNTNPENCVRKTLESEFNWKAYFQKLKTRCRTLLFPYVFWNAAWILVGICHIPLIYNFFKIRAIPSDYIFLLKCFWVAPLWNNTSNAPISGQFWFIRDLMIFVILAPILYWGIKKLKFVFLLSLSLLYFFFPTPPDLFFYHTINNFLVVDKFDTFGIGIPVFFFFALGAMYSIEHRLWLRDFSKFQIPVFIVYPILVFLDLSLRNNFVHKIQILAGIVFFANLAAHFIPMVKNKKVESFLLFLGSSSFFLFAFHQPWLKERTRDICQRIIPTVTDSHWIVVYFLQIFSTIVFSVIIYYFLKRFFPKITNLITGGR